MPLGQLNLLPTAVNATLSICPSATVQVPALVVGSIAGNWLAAVGTGLGQVQLFLIPQAQVCGATVGGQPVSTATLQPGAQPASVPTGTRPLGG